MAVTVAQKTNYQVGIKRAVALGFVLGGAGLLAASFVLVSQPSSSTPLPTRLGSSTGTELINQQVPCVASVGLVLDNQQSATIGRPCPSQFVAGELIVKFKNDTAVNSVKAFLLSNKGLSGNSLSALATTSRQFRLEKMSTIFNNSKMKVTDFSRVMKLSFPKDSDMKMVARQYQESEDVEYAEPNFIVSTNLAVVPADEAGGGGPVEPLVPNDPYFSSANSWGQGFDDQWSLKRVQLPQAWSQTTGQRNTIVAVVDTGVDLTHPDIQQNLWVNNREITGNSIDDDSNGFVDDVRGYDFTTCDLWINSTCAIVKMRDADPTDWHGHGTHVAGTVGATTNNSLGVAGVNWQVQIMPVKGLSDQGIGTYADLAAGIQYAVDNGATVINMSWGGTGLSSVLQAVIEYAHNLGVILVAAAGNNGSDVAGFYPANNPNVIRVAAWCPSNVVNAYCSGGSNGSRAKFSNWGDGIDITAPGVDVLSLRAYGTDMYDADPYYPPGRNIVGGQYYRSSGTSMAAPHVAGLAALMTSVFPAISPDQARSILDISAEDVLASGKDIYSGYGLINVPQAVQLAQTVAAGQGRPELIVKKAEVYWKSIVPNTSYVGEIHATISNIGFTLATNVGYQAQLGVPGNQVNAVTGEVPSLAPGATSEIVQPFTISSTPALSGTFQVDPYQLIIEHLETNNSLPLVTKYFSPTGWPTVTGDDVVGSPTVVDLDRGYPGLETIVGSYDGKVNAWHADGTPVPGWPVTLAGLYIYSSPVVADLDGDGNPEVVIGSFWDDSKVFAWHWNGQPVAGWPISVGVRADGTAAIADLDIAYPGMEVVMPVGNGKVFAWHADGTTVPGWPKTNIRYMISKSPAIGDLDPSYPGLEVAVAGDFDTNFYVWHADGTVMPGWPKILSGYADTSPAIADVDGDGRLEVFIGTKDGKMSAWHADGTILTGWPQTLAYPQVNSSPVVADLDLSYPGLEIISGATDGYDSVCECAHSAWYVWHADGTVKSGWPKNVLGTAMYSSPALADLDGDGRLEVVVGSLDGGIQGWHADGSPISGFPIQVQGQIWSSPSVADMNGDGKLEVVVGGGGTLGSMQNVFAWSMPWLSLGVAQPWPTPRHDVQRTGRFDTTPPVVTIKQPLSGARVSGTIAFSATATDDSGVKQVYFYLDNSTLLGTGTKLCKPILNGPAVCFYNLSWDSTSVGAGPHTVNARAFDFYGNQSTVSITITISSTGGGGGIRKITP